MCQLADALRDLNGVIYQHCGSWSVNITVGYQEAVVVDYAENEPEPFQLWHRTWDRTGGLRRDDEIGSAGSVADTVEAVVHYLAEQQLDGLLGVRRLTSQYFQEV